MTAEPPALRRRREARPKCGTPGCGRSSEARGYCSKHYAQVRRHGRLTPELERGETLVCAAPGCNRAAGRLGHCRKHAVQIRDHGRLTPERERMTGSRRCSVPRCSHTPYAKGFCSLHYERARARRRAKDAD